MKEFLDNKDRKANRLINEKSPYLLQHAYNPINWYSWGEEAFEKAKQEDKPIFLSIGYSSCHWCHVMEHESFEDQEVASVLNQHYISIKVDREERPDVDHIYMTVCQAMTGQGGWPLTIIMTPDKKPFFAGTYLPKEDRYGQTGLLSLLKRIDQLWKQDRARADQASERVVEAIQAYLDPVDAGELDAGAFDLAFEQFSRQFDETYGGFGSEPKFPRPHDFLFLLRYWKQTGEPEALHMVTRTLDAMRRGGIYDHLGYGFARYSVDREWLIPHFEKMLYDNALLAIAYLETYQATKEEKYAQVAREIFTYVLRDMTDVEGGFYSAEDADSEGEEGKFYVWTPEQIRKVLGEEEGDLFCACYDVTTEGNFEHGTSNPNQIRISLPDIARVRAIPYEQLVEKLTQSRDKLFTARKQRIHPLKDDKVLTAWNGLMITALARGARVLGDQSYADAAIKAVRFIEQKLHREDGRLLARYRDGESAYLAYLDDYAFLVWALTELYEATFQIEFLDQAIHLNQQAVELFGDDQASGFFFYGKDGEKLLTRPKEIYDGAIPSGNSVMAYNLIRLAKLTFQEDLLHTADQQLKAFANSAAEIPTSHSFYLLALQFALGATKEIVIVGERQDPETEAMIRCVQESFLPDAVIAFQSRTEGEGSRWATSVVGGGQEGTGAVAYICENYACQAPIYDVEQLRERLGAFS